MLRIVRLCERHAKPATAIRGAALIAVAMAVGGCSAGFEMPSLSYNGGPASTNAVPIPREPVYQNRGYAPPSEERSYGQPPGQPYGQPYSQPYNPPDNSGFGRAYGPTGDDGARPYSPPYEPRGRSEIPPDNWRESNRGTPITPEGERGVRVAGLPDPYDRGARTDTVPAPGRGAPPPSVPYSSVEPTPPAPPLASAPADGETIEVRPGDTLYALSKKHAVPVSELMRANNLTGPQLRPGQKLVVPSSRPTTRRFASLPSAPMSEPAPVSARTPPAVERPEPRLPHHEVGPIVPPLVETEPARAPVAAPAPAPAPRSAAASEEAGWTGAYTVERGDSLFAIARKHGIRLNDLERVNNITNPRRVMPGTVLMVPRPGEAQRAAAAPPAPVASAPAKPVPATSVSAGPPSVEPTIINARTRVAALPKDAAAPQATAADASPSAPAATTEPPLRDAAVPAPKSAIPTAKFRWPARGKIISSFGPQAEGRNEGINIALPRGADVHAAEAGVVTYAGDGVQGYGNLLLIRHDGGWITAYAHNDSLAVKSGESVRRGQVIAKAGATGSVDHPQLHFEIRQGTKPVDPVKHLEN